MTGEPSQTNSTDAPSRYLVVARRYRPQTFTDLVGQQAVSRALSNAIATDRIGHAYLFTGARGVGKTSTARIFAKSLNCVQGPTPTPCNQCDMCLGVAEGHDVDVLEIDGASNRGIDEIRQLRSSVGVRPSRARFKIYIIDEVHMLTREAFNALLKTLEEPPPHVKFLFCTTSPEKIPITVLSRCQRFDFPPVEIQEIVGRLTEIVAAEDATAEPEALEILARRAAGSMRDSQSLLEQMLAFSGSQITAQYVHEMLGTASAHRVLGLLQVLLDRDAAGALAELETAVSEGVDPGQLAEQLLGLMRDLLVVAVGGAPDLLLQASRNDFDQLRTMADQWGTETLLAAAQVLDHALVRMRQSLHGRTLLELALIRVARLEHLDTLSSAISQLSRGDGPSPTAPGKKKIRPESARTPSQNPTPHSRPAAHAHPSSKPVATANATQATVSESTDRPDEPVPMTQTPADQTPADQTLADQAPADQAPADGTSSTRESAEPETNAPASSLEQSATAAAPGTSPAGTSPDAASEWNQPEGEQVWQRALAELDGITADFARKFERVATFAPNRLVIVFPSRYNSSKLFCERPERRAELETAVRSVANRPVRLDFEVTGGPPAPALQKSRPVSHRQLIRDVESHPLVKRTVEVFGAEISAIDPPRPKDDS